MSITIDEHSGFCFGVTSAINKAEEELAKGPLYCLGDIVHNGQEVDRLERLGLTTIDYDDLRTLHGGRVLLRAHGEPPSTYAIARANNIEVIDASCPVVLHLQKRIRDTYLAHPEAQIVIFGKVGHAEVIGLMGQTNNNAIIVESEADLSKIDFTRDIYLFSQTTMSVEAFEALVENIKNKISYSPQDGLTAEGGRTAPAVLQAQPVFEFYNSICRNVANRVAQLQAFARAHDLVIFVGGSKSSNAKVLYNHCLAANPNTIFISSPDELDETVASRSTDLSIGICGATSTPQWLMEAVKEKMSNLKCHMSNLK